MGEGSGNRPEPASPPVAAKGGQSEAKTDAGAGARERRGEGAERGTPPPPPLPLSPLPPPSLSSLSPSQSPPPLLCCAAAPPETRLHRVLKPCGLQQQQTASTGLSVFELRRGDALAPLYALAKCF